ncbi:MAG: transcription elongation factor GreA [Gammaproteobacteria bacterium]|nr:transcription elongation factor GreA [Gammaproteobacteria bacterium]MCZ6488447.1 transcription elongation factor GreA [Gammaproteobacteria bacterium]MCZ6578032.1 transcription elongation factor GreA [Gammaproteobacteria bacterium]MCZ6667240.1 transcription elongation factor GreA [Gammaproteobacteria bacterium]MCZ6724466.1 transcription elongation factor GreA [Gammaproteobacteria bacterium]
MNQIPLTATGAERLRAELKDLKYVKRPIVIEAIAVAREHGDLKENAEYHAAREEQGFMEGRIAEIEAALSNAQIIDVTKLSQNDRVVFGCTVDLIDIESEAQVSYQIVGDIEADINECRIAISSPIARALIGKEEGEDVSVQAPAGVREYEITAIHYQ